MWYRKGFLLYLLFFSTLYAQEYPKIFASLGTPLYKAAPELSHFTNIKTLEPKIQHYQNSVKKALQDAVLLEKVSDKTRKIAYLQELRRLQKEYDYIIHLLHRDIQKAIKDDEYHTFIELTSYALPGLLEPHSLRERALKYYKKNRSKRRTALLESFLKEDELLTATTQEFFNQPKSSQFTSHATKQVSKKEVYITQKKGKNYTDIFFTNPYIYDVTVEVKSHYKNIKERAYVAKIFVLKAKSTLKYAQLNYMARHVRYSIGYRWIIGSKDAKHDNSYLYRLPYRVGTSHMVSQGFHGKATHTGHSEYAVDFKMDVGTKIYAARGGLVVKTKEDSNKRGYAKKFAKYGNYVTVLHSDGTFGTYYHLKKGGVLVHVGQRVTRGEALGYSGNTGYSSGPHLHFEVFKTLSSLKTQSLPIKFISSRGVVSNPQKGHSYKAK